MLYTSTCSLVDAALLFSLFRPEIDMTVSPVRNPTFIALSDGPIRNTYVVRLRNKQDEARPFQISLTSEANLQIDVQVGEDQTIVVPDAQQLTRVYVSAPPDSPVAEAARTGLRLWAGDLVSNDRASVETVFNGKGSFDERSSVGP